MKNVKRIAAAMAVMASFCEYAGAMETDTYTRIVALPPSRQIEEVEAIVRNHNSSAEDIFAVTKIVSGVHMHYWYLMKENRREEAEELEQFRGRYDLWFALLDRLYGIAIQGSDYDAPWNDAYRAAQFILNDSVGFVRNENYANDCRVLRYTPRSFERGGFMS
jgi:hypothetical protein